MVRKLWRSSVLACVGMVLAQPVGMVWAAPVNAPSSALGAAPQTAVNREAASVLLQSVRRVVAQNPQLADSVGDRALIAAVKDAAATHPSMRADITRAARNLKPHLSQRIELAATNATAFDGTMATMESDAPPAWATAPAPVQATSRPPQGANRPYAVDADIPEWAMASAAPVASARGGAEDEAVLDMGLEDLMNTKVVTASKSKERAFDVPAAISVISNEDLRRSGVTSVVEALRMVPGVQVSQFASDGWAVSARGFGEQYGNKMLVLIDGRSVYTPTFSGVFWENVNLPLEDVDRIEVIRGPGATIWGANAVNGVINIVTKDSRYTQGAYATVGAGNHEKIFGAARSGGTFGDDGYYRLYTRYHKRGSFDAIDGTGQQQDWWDFLTGFRSDWSSGKRHKFTVHAELQKAGADQMTSPFDSETTEAYLRGKWTQALDDGSTLTFSSYLDRRDFQSTTIHLEEVNADMDFNHQLRWWDRNELIWGGGYRFTTDHYDPGPRLNFIPDSDQRHLFSAFVQNKFEATEKLDLTLGSKFEHNDYTGFEVQPTAKFAYDTSQRSMVWGSVARAVRTPSRVEDSIRLTLQEFPANPPTAPLPQQVVAFGNSGVEAEDLIAYELGYRFSPQEGLLFDLTAYYNDYNNLTTLTPGAPQISPPNIIIPTNIYNLGEAEVYGIELSSSWQVSPHWRLAGYYTFSRMKTDTTTGSQLFLDYESLWPEHTASLRSYYNIREDLELDMSLYYVSALDNATNVDLTTTRDIDSYLRADVRLGWQPLEQLELSLAGLNLLEGEHDEFIDSRFQNASLIGRTYYGKATVRF